MVTFLIWQLKDYKKGEYDAYDKVHFKQVLLWT